MLSATRHVLLSPIEDCTPERVSARRSIHHLVCHLLQSSSLSQWSSLIGRQSFSHLFDPNIPVWFVVEVSRTTCFRLQDWGNFNVTWEPFWRCERLLMNSQRKYSGCYLQSGWCQQGTRPPQTFFPAQLSLQPIHFSLLRTVDLILCRGRYLLSLLDVPVPKDMLDLISLLMPVHCC